MQLALRDLIEIFQVSERTIVDWIEKRDMPCLMVNEQYRFNYVELLEWVLEDKIRLTQDFLALTDEERITTPSLCQALKNGHIYYEINGVNRREIVKSIIDLLPLPVGENRDFLFEWFVARELMESTTISGGIAIPHVRNPIVLDIDQPSVTLCFLKKPVDFSAPDQKLVHAAFVILVPSVRMHLGILAQLGFCLQNPQLRECLQAKSREEEIMAEFIVCESGLLSVKK